MDVIAEPGRRRGTDAVPQISHQGGIGEGGHRPEHRRNPFTRNRARDPKPKPAAWPYRSDRGGDRPRRPRAQCVGGRAEGGTLTDVSVQLDAALEELTRRAQQAGLVRADLVTEDLPRMVAMLNSVLGTMDPASDGWRRYVALMLDAISTSKPGRLPRAVPIHYSQRLGGMADLMSEMRFDGEVRRRNRRRPGPQHTNSRWYRQYPPPTEQSGAPVDAGGWGDAAGAASAAARGADGHRPSRPCSAPLYALVSISRSTDQEVPIGASVADGVGDCLCALTVRRASGSAMTGRRCVRCGTLRRSGGTRRRSHQLREGFGPSCYFCYFRSRGHR